MSSVGSHSLDLPDETRTFPNGQAQLVSIGTSTIGRFTFQPGWRWSVAVKPIVGTDHCEVHHVGYALAGRLHVIGSDGIETEIAMGDAYDISPGHDGWVVGDEPFIGVEFANVDAFARPR
jgi:hypothetical protein